MTQLKYFKIIYIALIFIFFIFNFFKFSDLVFRDSSSKAKDTEIKGTETSKVPDDTPFEISEGLIEDDIRIIKNINYINDNIESKKLDLFLPKEMYKNQKYPLIIYIHGGAWLEGNKEYFKDYELVKNDFIVASVDYRLSTEDLFPAQIHDIKASVRWLRENANKYNIDSENIGAYGESAGGHLASLLGTTALDSNLNGNIGQNLNQSTYVKAVVSEFGLFDLSTIAEECEKNQLCITKYRLSDSIVSKLLGCSYNNCGEKLNSASPINYLNTDSGSFLLLHGEKDEIVPYQQTKDFEKKALEENLFVKTIISEEGKHIDNNDRLNYFPEIVEFFNYNLKENKYYFCESNTDFKETFSDINKSDEDFSAINKLECKNAFYGVVNDKFEPERKITRVEVIKILFNIFKQKINTNCNNFNDVDKNDENYIFIQSLKCSEKIKGYENNEFKPENTMNYAELLSLLSKYKDIDINKLSSKIDQNKPNLQKEELTRRNVAYIISSIL